MNFEIFREQGRGFEPKASIRKQGQIGLNQGAIIRYNIKDDQDVLLAYDKENRVIGIKPIGEPEKGSKRAVIKNNNCSIAAKAFFDFFDIPYKKETKTYELFEDKENGYICFKVEDFNEE